jgi:hypothetical protein
MIKLPEKLNQIRDQIIDHVRKKSPLPDNLCELTEWLETDGWDILVPSWDSDEHIALNLSYLSWLKFSDSELLSIQEDDEPVTDEVRIRYAQKLVTQTFDSYDDYICPSVQIVELKKSNGDAAVLGWLIEIHGQGGPVPIYQGAFVDKNHFYQHLKECDFLLDLEKNNLANETILRLWTYPPKPIRSIVVSVNWGHEQYECPMAERTWKRIAQGKPVRRVEPHLYEGKRFKAEWWFNTPEIGSLLVTYDDGGVGFEGRLEDALIRNDNENSSWLSQLIKYGSSYSLLDALVQRSSTNNNSPPPYDYWIVEDSFVCEPSIGGQLKGEVAALNLKGKRLLRISQEECDALLEAVFKEDGAYPDT